MARKVYITNEMSTDERLLNVAEEDQLAALIWPWILTAFDDWGRSEAKPKELKAKIFPGNEMVSAETIDTALALYNKNGLLKLYKVDERLYMAIPKDKWFKYQTQIRREKRTKDDSHFPAPPDDTFSQVRADAREYAQVREVSSKCIPSPSTLPPFHPSPSINDDDDDDNANEGEEKRKASGNGTKAINYAEQIWGRPIKEIECDSILKAFDEFSTRGSPESENLVKHALELCSPPEIKVKIRYFDTIVRVWLDNGILTVEKAKQDYQKAKEGKAREVNHRNLSKHGTLEQAESPRKYPITNYAADDPL